MNSSENEASEDVVRHVYQQLTDDQKEQVRRVKDAGQKLIQILGEQGESRELSLAKTKAEESVMWATKHITSG